MSTSDGIEGLPVKSGKHAIIANDPKSFADGLRQMLNESTRLALAESCRNEMARFLSEDEDAKEIKEISAQAINAKM